MSEPTAKIVACADRLREIYRETTSWKKMRVLLLANIPLVALGWMFHAEWLPAAGLMGAGFLIVVPHILRTHRFITSLPCPACGGKTGSYFSLNGRYYLKCGPCGKVSPTDCGSLGSPPYKI